MVIIRIQECTQQHYHLAFLPSFIHSFPPPYNLSIILFNSIASSSCPLPLSPTLCVKHEAAGCPFKRDAKYAHSYIFCEWAACRSGIYHHHTINLLAGCLLATTVTDDDIHARLLIVVSTRKDTRAAFNCPINGSEWGWSESQSDRRPGQPRERIWSDRGWCLFS